MQLSGLSFARGNSLWVQINGWCNLVGSILVRFKIWKGQFNGLNCVWVQCNGGFNLVGSILGVCNSSRGNIWGFNLVRVQFSEVQFVNGSIGWVQSLGSNHIRVQFVDHRI